MKLAEVLAALAAIEARGGDDETQHILEDALRTAVLKAIAEGRAEQPQLLASAALASSAIDFSRWPA